MRDTKISFVSLKPDNKLVLEALRYLLSLSYEKGELDWSEIREAGTPNFMKFTMGLRLVLDKFAESFPLEHKDEILRILITGLQSTLPLEEGPKRL